MAIREEEMKNVTVGDQIVVISEREAREKGHWYGRVARWNCDDEIGMNRWCGHTLTVRSIIDKLGEIRLFVEENSFWWGADFIQAVVPQEELEAIEFKDLEAILFGSVV